MKRNLLWFFSMMVMMSALTITSCEDDPCKDVECGDNGTCFDGVCICDQGYELDAVTGLCVEEPCFNVVCGDNATCVDGDCVCDDGYIKNSNDSCVLERTIFLGSWNASETCGSGSDTYTVTITAGAVDNEININNFYGTGLTAVATVSGRDLTIASQTDSNITFSGTGSYDDANGISITVTYDLADTGGNTDTCTSVYTP